MDYFAILGVSRSATSEEIKQAYRAKVRQYHPDRNSDPDAPQRFQEVVEAYETLSNPEKRSAYVAARIRMPNRQASPWHRKKQPHSYIYFLVGILCFGSVILLAMLEQASEDIILAFQADATTCHVVEWEQEATGRYRLHYEALSVPWQVGSFHSWRVFDEVDNDYLPGTGFTCYYNEEWQATQLRRYEWGDLWRIMPWMFLGVVMVVGSGYYLLK